jgi:succinate-semialdehyde dehydrogenase / glutarate-semialdehyde dehydrogenase
MALKRRHAGQACITANRVLVQRGVYEKFTAMLIERTEKLKVGHGADIGTTMGPVTTSRGLDKVAAHVRDAVSKGGNLILGGRKIPGDGYFFVPTVITDATKDMLISREESFAPVCALFPFETEEEAVKAANDTSVCYFLLKVAVNSLPLKRKQMGLASYFFTKNVDRTWRLLENLEAGMIGMNTGKHKLRALYIFACQI